MYAFFIFILSFNLLLKISGNFQLSPDFRQRASSNASSCGRLSPIQSIVGIENTWVYPAELNEFNNDNQNNQIDDPTANETDIDIDLSAQNQATLDQLAGSLADDLTLQQNKFVFEGSVCTLREK